MIALGWVVLLGRSAAGHPVGVTRTDLPRVALTGAIGYSGYIVLSTLGLARTTAFSNALLVSMAPVFAVLLLRALGLEAVRRVQVAGLLVAVVGVGVFLADKLQSALPEAGLGDLLSLVGAGLFAAYTVAQKPLVDRYAVPVMMAHTCTIGAVPVLLLAWPAALAQDWAAVSLVAWASLAWTTVVPVYLAWSLWAWVIARAGVARTSAFMFLVPVSGGVASHMLFGETFGALKLAGAALILTGLALVRRAPATDTGPPEGCNRPESSGRARAVTHGGGRDPALRQRDGITSCERSG
jgi:drug/metabolite transporter (DMT)-like permease